MATASSSSAGAGSSIARLPVRAYHATTNASIVAPRVLRGLRRLDRLRTSGAPAEPVQRGRDMTESIVSGWRFKSVSGISNSTSAPVLNARTKRMLTPFEQTLAMCRHPVDGAL